MSSRLLASCVALMHGTPNAESGVLLDRASLFEAGRVSGERVSTREDGEIVQHARNNNGRTKASNNSILASSGLHSGCKNRTVVCTTTTQPRACVDLASGGNALSRVCDRKQIADSAWMSPSRHGDGSV